MYGLFRKDQIEDYYDVLDLIAVAETEEPLNLYIDNANKKIVEHNRLCDLYVKLFHSVKAYSGKAPEKEKFPEPKTKAEHREAKLRKIKFNADLVAFEKKRSNHQQDRATELLCLQENIEPEVGRVIVNCGHKIQAEYIIKPIRVLK